MAYDDLILFVSIGWFISVAVIFMLYIRVRKLSEEIRHLKSSIQITDDFPETQNKH